MQVTVSRHPSVPCGYLITNDADDRTEMCTFDHDFPNLARTFGWDMIAYVQAEPMRFRCRHHSTDGSIDCTECGVTASEFITEARAWLNSNTPKTVEDADGLFPDLDDDEPQTVRQSCDQCNVAHINGVRCHETGCPIAWRDHTVECGDCGCEFQPEHRHQSICDGCNRAAINDREWDDLEANGDLDDDLKAASDFMSRLEADQSEPIIGTYTDNHPQ